MSGMQNQRHLYSGKYTAPQSGDRARPPNDLSNTHPPDLGLTAVPQQQGTVDVNPTGNSRQLPVTGLYRHRLISPGQQRVHLVQVGGGDPSVPAIGSRNGFQVGRNGIEHVTRGDGRVPCGAPHRASFAATSMVESTSGYQIRNRPNRSSLVFELILVIVSVFATVPAGGAIVAGCAGSLQRSAFHAVQLGQP